MRIFSASEILAVCESGRRLHPIDRALRLLCAAHPDRDASEFARLPLGARDSLLLGIRAHLLGDRIEACDTCPQCGTRVELDLSARELGCSEAARADCKIELGAFALRLRPIDSCGAAVAAQCADAASARVALLRNCIVEATENGENVAAAALPPDVVASAIASLEAADPGAEIVLRLDCPGCGNAWSNGLDVATFVWMEIAAIAARLLGEVDRLARAYGWSEPEILRLSDARRAAYLTLASA